MWAPGDYLVIDWAVVGGLHLFCAVMAYLTVAVRRVRHRRESHHYTGFDRRSAGRSRRCPREGPRRPDGLPQRRGGGERGHPTPAYVRFATHYGFAPDFCHANDPQSKGIVENLVGYSQRDLAVPLLTDSAVAGTTVDVHTTNAAATLVRRSQGAGALGAPREDAPRLLRAAKWVGNQGTHAASDATPKDVFDMVEYVEIALKALYAPDHADALARADRIHAAKGLVP